mgnify:CR=1 FL=1
MGDNNPIRIQSMTNTSTMDTLACVEQSIRIIEAGGDYVRLTAQGVREAENLANIKNDLHKKGYYTPLVADIHFNPSAAEAAAKIVEKVRINPGNFVDCARKLLYSRHDFSGHSGDDVHRRDTLETVRHLIWGLSLLPEPVCFHFCVLHRILR